VPLRKFSSVFPALYSAIKKNKILSFAGKWMDLENIILREVSQSQNAQSCMFSLICGQ
jgi:hypothetical protein